MELGSVVKIIKQHAPTSLAESWDNVGLLVEPSSPHTVNTIMLTNDLTPPVLEESLEKKVDLILSYHPPIFSAVKRLSQGKWKDRLIIKCIENRIAVYSPHTCYDAKAGGVNDWLIGAFDTSNVVPVTNAEEIPGGYSHKVNILTKDSTNLQSVLSSLAVKQVSSPITTSSGEVMTVCSVLCNKCTLSEVFKAVEGSDCEVDTIENVKLEKIPVSGYGSGRYATLKQPLTPQEAVDAVKKHLNLLHVRLAAKPGNKYIKSVAVCAGSGSSVLRGVNADLYLTGEMSHHEVLDAVYSGANVILCDHSNTERGYLKQVKQELSEKLKDVNILISETDMDPLVIV
ncbi:hypothetical protein SNE40_006774 [Patella caerulea]